MAGDTKVFVEENSTTVQVMFYRIFVSHKNWVIKQRKYFFINFQH